MMGQIEWKCAIKVLKDVFNICIDVRMVYSLNTLNMNLYMVGNPVTLSLSISKFNI